MIAANSLSIYQLTGFLQSLYYIFAQLGMQIWAGSIDPDNPDLQVRHMSSSISYSSNHRSSFDQNSAYGQADYWAISFNSFGNSLVLLFSLNLVNNWDGKKQTVLVAETFSQISLISVVAEAFVTVSNEAAMIYFILFEILGVIIVQKYLSLIISQQSCTETFIV